MRAFALITLMTLLGCQKDVPLSGQPLDITPPLDAAMEVVEEVEHVEDTYEVVLEDVAEEGPELPDLTKKDVDDADLGDPVEAEVVEDEVIETAPTTGCMDVLACNYIPNAMVDDGSCLYAEENYDCSNNCLLETDCLDVCGGTAKVDGCGVCEGSGPLYCTDSGVPSDCDDVDVYIKLENFMQNPNDFWGVDVMISFGKEIWGYQFNIDTEDIISYEGGLTEEYEFFGANSVAIIVALTLDINPIVAENRDFVLLIKVYGQGSALPADGTCISGPIFATGPDMSTTPPTTPPSFGLKTGVCDPCAGL